MNSTNPSRRFTDFQDYLEATRSDVDEDQKRPAQPKPFEKYAEKHITAGSVRDRILAFSGKQSTDNNPTTNAVHRTTSVNIRERMNAFQRSNKAESVQAGTAQVRYQAVPFKFPEGDTEPDDVNTIDVQKNDNEGKEAEIRPSNFPEELTGVQTTKCVSFNQDECESKVSLGKYVLTPMPSEDDPDQDPADLDNAADGDNEKGGSNLLEMRKHLPMERLNTLEIEEELVKIDSERNVPDQAQEQSDRKSNDRMDHVEVEEVEKTLKDFEEKVKSFDA